MYLIADGLNSSLQLVAIGLVGFALLALHCMVCSRILRRGHIYRINCAPATGSTVNIAKAVMNRLWSLQMTPQLLQLADRIQMTLRMVCRTTMTHFVLHSS